jgi:hypothetical protein
MGNPHRGEVTFESGGKLYTVALDFYAQAILQRQSKMPASQFFARPITDWGADDILHFYYAMLFRRHRMTEEQVSDLLEDIGSLEIVRVMNEAIEAAAARTGITTAKPNPPEAEMSSTSA